MSFFHFFLYLHGPFYYFSVYTLKTLHQLLSLCFVFVLAPKAKYISLICLASLCFCRHCTDIFLRCVPLNAIFHNCLCFSHSGNGICKRRYLVVVIVVPVADADTGSICAFVFALVGAAAATGQLKWSYEQFYLQSWSVLFVHLSCCLQPYRHHHHHHQFYHWL